MDLHRAALRALLRHVRGGAFRVVYWDGVEERFGKGTPLFCLRIHDRRCLPTMPGSIGLKIGEALVDGRIEVDDLDAFLALGLTQEFSSGWRLPALGRRLRSRNRDSLRRQGEEVRHHYDRGNDFFALWLDASRTYSCAYFETPEATLEEAQTAKRQHILRKLQLAPGQKLLDIGCGWGALLFDAARRYGVHAHGITLSRQQYQFVREQAQALGVTAQVRVDLADYRELAAPAGAYDRVVSVGMFEHVGRKNHGSYMAAVARLLKPGGLSLLHTITRRNECATDAWLRRYIFPGAFVPSWRRVVALLGESGFELLDVEDLRMHYPPTLDRWAERFEARLPEVRALGYDERFIRMWRLYFHAVAAAFRYEDYSVHQFLISRGHSASPAMTRAHLYARAPSRNPPLTESRDEAR